MFTFVSKDSPQSIGRHNDRVNQSTFDIIDSFIGKFCMNDYCKMKDGWLGTNDDSHTQSKLY